MTDTQLDGRRIVVTGGSSGMGAGLVRALPRLGARVVSLDLAVDPGREIAESAGANFVAADVSDRDSVFEAVAAGAQLLGGLDVVIHAAGIAPGAPAEEISLADWDRIMAVNATGTFLTNQAAFPHLRENGGQILNFASAAGVQGYPMKPPTRRARVRSWPGRDRSPSNGRSIASRSTASRRPSGRPCTTRHARR